MKKKKNPDKDLPNSHRTIKCSLKTILRNKEIQSTINDLVIKCNNIIIETYQFIRLFCLYKYHNKQDIPELTEKFILYCIKCLGIRDNRGKKADNDNLLTELNQFYENEFKSLLDHKYKYELKNMSFLLPYLATQLHTSFHNNLKEHFITRLLRFINKTTTDYEIGLDKEQVNKERTKLKNALYDNTEYPERYREWYELYRKYILPEKWNKSLAYDVKVYPCKYIIHSIYMNEVLENKEMKLFQPISLRNTIIPHYITIDTATLISLFGEKGMKGKLLKNITENQFYVWNKYFNFDLKIFRQKNYKFNYTIQTDGVGVSLLFVHKDYTGNSSCINCKVKDDYDITYLYEYTKEQLEIQKNKTIIGCDPGKFNLVYMTDGKNILRYTAFQRRTESMAKRNAKILYTEKLKNNIIDKETQLSTSNSKTVNYNKFKDYLIKKNKLNTELRDFYNKEIYRKMKWRQFVYTKKSEDRFLNKIEETFGNNISIAYGDWSRTTQMKHFIPTKGIGMRKLIAKRYETYAINEYRTSKLCNCCHNDLSYFKFNNNKVFRYLMCNKCVSSQSENNTFITRDLNSALNIRNLALQWIAEQTRPSAFNRVGGLTT